MKTFTKYLLTAVAVLALAMTLNACSKSSSDGGGTVTSTPTTTTQGSQAASAGTQGSNMGSGSATTFQNLGQIGLSSAVGVGAPPLRIAGSHTLDPGLEKSAKLSAKLAKSKALNKAVSAFKKAKSMGAATVISGVTDTCADGGTVTTSGTSDTAAGTFDLTMTAANCREYGTKIDGAMEISGSINSSGAINVTEKLGTDASNKLTILEFSDVNYSVLVSKMETLITMTMGGAVDSLGNMTSVTMDANGTMNVLDYMNQGTYAMTFTNMSIVISDTVAATGGAETAEIAIDGAFSETWTDTSVTPNVANSVSMSFSQFRVSDVYASATAVAFDETITGGFSIDFTPDDCFEGAYAFETVTPIHYDTSGMTTAGKIKINTVVEVVFNSNGTITVTLNGTQVYSGDEYGLATVCEFQTLEEPSPTSSGSTGNANGDTMTITLSWDGPGGVSASDMDLHMNYYATATPGASTVGTSYVDWHGLNSCQNGYSGMDIAGDGTCEIALDFDDTDGYGPEHITAASLPAGYYVVSVNSYGLYGDTSQTVNVSIQIGSSVFGPFTHTFTTSDGEGTTSGAWFAVADIVVASSGSVTVQAHNTALELWHDGAFGIAAPALRAKGLR